MRESVRITPEGRALHDAWARVVAGTETEEAVTRAYERFLPLNAEFLRLCHDWQVRPGNVPNDHGDVAYDWAVIDRLRALDERAAPVLRRVGRALDRFDAYPRRLRAALAQRRQRRNRVVHLAPHRLVPHRVDAWLTRTCSLPSDDAAKTSPTGSSDKSRCYGASSVAKSCSFAQARYTSGSMKM